MLNLDYVTRIKNELFALRTPRITVDVYRSVIVDSKFVLIMLYEIRDKDGIVAEGERLYSDLLVSKILLRLSSKSSTSAYLSLLKR